MKHTTTLSTIALILAAGSFALVGGCSKTEQSASTEQTEPEVATLESQPAAEQAPATAEQAAASTEPTQTTTDAPSTVAGETE